MIFMNFMNLMNFYEIFMKFKFDKTYKYDFFQN